MHPMIIQRVLTCLFLLTVALTNTSGIGAQELPLLLTEDFEKGSTRWQATDAEMDKCVWSVQEEDGNHFLRVAGKSSYQPPHRSPHSICWLAGTSVADFDLKVSVQNTRPDAGPHRDLCLFWGEQDAGHFYYVHLGARPDPHSCQIFIVNGAARKAITENEPKGTLWKDGWHTVRIRRRVNDGLMEVYFDDMETPCMVAHDRTFLSGRIGLGTFDDHGNFDNVELRGTRIVNDETAEPAPASRKSLGAEATQGSKASP